MNKSAQRTIPASQITVGMRLSPDNPLFALGRHGERVSAVRYLADGEGGLPTVYITGRGRGVFCLSPDDKIVVYESSPA